MRPFKVGLQLPDSEGMFDGATARWGDIAAYARRAEEIGFDSLWAQDHFLFRFGPETEGTWECFGLLAAVAAVTTRAEIGSLVACSSFRQPSLTAKIAETIDEISHGRFILGIGAGWHQADYDALGVPFDGRAGRFAEAIEIISSLLRTGRAELSGKHYWARASELRPRGPRPQGPPIMVGGKGPRMLALAARCADRWNAYFLSFGNRPDGVAELRAKVDAACRAIGRDPESLERSVTVLVDVAGDRKIPKSVGEGVAPVRGTPREIAQQLRAYADEGISHLQLYALPMTTAGLDVMGEVLAELDR